MKVSRRLKTTRQLHSTEVHRNFMEGILENGGLSLHMFLTVLCVSLNSM